MVFNTLIQDGVKNVVRIGDRGDGRNESSGCASGRGDSEYLDLILQG